MKKTGKIVLGSVLAMALCASLATGATFALFSSESTTDITITSGKVSVSASVTNFHAASNVTDTAGATWAPATEQVGSGDWLASFQGGGYALYSPNAGTLSLNNIDPGDAVKFTLNVTNTSTISVRYQVRIFMKDEGYTGSATDPHSEDKLSSHLEIDFSSTVGEEYASALYAASEWSDVVPSSTVTAEGAEVIIRLPNNLSDNYEGKTCLYSLTVVAIQGNARTRTICEEQGHSYDGNDNCIYCGKAMPFEGAEDSASGTYTIKKVNTDEPDLVIPGTIHGKHVVIGEKALENNTALKSVTLQEGVVEIGESAFAGCENLASVVLPDGLTKIGYGAFMNSGLKSVVIPATVTSLGNEWTAADDGATSEFNQEALSWAALTVKDFSETGKLISGIVSKGTKLIGSVFANTPLTKVEFAAGSKLTIIPHGCFYDCKDLTEVTLPDTLEIIGEGAFAGCNLRKFNIPDSVTHVLNTAFARNEHLNHLEIGEKVEAFGYQINTTDEALNTYYPGASLFLYQYGFKDAASIANFLNPSPVENCYRLVEIENRSGIEITPETLSGTEENLGGIGKYARVLGVLSAGAKSGLSNVVTDEGTFTFYEGVDGEKYLVDFITAGGDTVTMPDIGSDYAIHDHAFYKAPIGGGYSDPNRALKNINFGTHITSIGDHAFENCVGVMTIDLHECKNLTSVGAYAFAVDGSVGRTSGGNASALKTVWLGNSVETIEKGAFYYCDNLQHVHISDYYLEAMVPGSGSKLKSIGDEAFSFCERLHTVCFAGTKAAWGQCQTGKGIFTNVTDCTVKCSDSGS